MKWTKSHISHRFCLHMVIFHWSFVKKTVILSGQNYSILSLDYPKSVSVSISNAFAINILQIWVGCLCLKSFLVVHLLRKVQRHFTNGTEFTWKIDRDIALRSWSWCLAMLERRSSRQLVSSIQATDGYNTNEIRNIVNYCINERVHCFE